MKKHINIALTTLAFVGMMAFASQAAMAASINDNTPDTPSKTHVQNNTPSTIHDNSIDVNNQSAADDVNDVEDNQDAADAVSSDVDQASEAADIGDNIESPASNLELDAGDYGVETGDH